MKNVTKYTTCEDVKHVLMLKFGISIKRISSFSLFEVSGDLERMLQGRTRILKTLRLWGSERANLKLVLKAVNDDKTCLLKDNVPEYVDSAVDVHTTAIREEREFLYSPLLIKSSRSTLSNDKSLVKYAVKKSLKPTETLNCADEKEQNILSVKDFRGEQDIEKAENMPITDNSMSTSHTQKKSKGRKALFQKCLHGLIPLRKTRRSTIRSNKGLVRNEVAVDNISIKKQPSDNAENTLNSQFPDLEEICRYYWNSNSESDNESDIDDESDLLLDFNKAFLKSGRDDSCDQGIDDSDSCFGDLNTAFIDENNIRINSSKSSVDDTDISISDTSDCELEQNISSCDVVRNIFCGGQSPSGAVSEDDAMDSFMRTKIYDSESEEELY